MIVFGARSVDAQDLHFFIQVSIVCNDHAAVTDTSQVFGWEERKTAYIADTPGSFHTAAERALGTDRLGCVLYYFQAVFSADRYNALHIGHLPEQVDRYDGPDAGQFFTCHLFQECFQLPGIDIEGGGIDIGKYRFCTEPCNAARCCEKRVRRCNDDISMACAQGHQRQQKRIGA